MKTQENLANFNAILTLSFVLRKSIDLNIITIYLLTKYLEVS